MSILQQELVESKSGFKKEIDEGGISLLLDTVQVYMYQFPVKSSIRESVSNAIDAISEKNIAKQVLRNEAKSSDFYIEKDGEIYKDSKFDKDYYNLKYLSDNDTVYIKYNEGDGIQIKDSITIRDNGVGLGEKRLEGYFKIAYSSKRLNTKVLGAFGMGAKAPLSTGVDFFSLKTAHNGKEFSFLIYKDKVDCCYTKWNEDGSQNDFITFSNGFKVYYKKTTSTNYVETSWDVKRHQKHQYIDSVKSQLLYFKSPISFEVSSSYGYVDKINFQADILYETEDFIIADQHYYSRPHLIVNGVCYGFIQFEELEMDNRYGSIGIKVSMDDITVTPSRESCVWNTKTKDSILRKYTCLSQTAEEYINKSLDNLGYLDWLSTCYHINGNIFSKNDKNTKILMNLANLAGFKSLKLKYKKTDFQFKASLPESIESNSIELIKVQEESYYHKKSGTYKKKVKYTTSTSLDSIVGSKKFIQYGESNAIKSYYLVTKNNNYMSIRPSSKSGEEYKELFKEFVTGKISLGDAIAKIKDFKLLIDIPENDVKHKTQSMENGLKFINIMLEEKIEFYEDVIVPDDFTKDIDDDEEAEIVAGSVDTFKVKEKIDYSKRRKETGKVLIHYPRLTYRNEIVKSKTEMPISDIQDFDGTLIYSFKEDEALVNLLYILSRKEKNYYDSDHIKFEGDFRLCIIAKTAEKYFKEHTHIKKYIFGEDEKTPCPELVKWFTSARVHEKTSSLSLKYFDKFGEFSKELKDTYVELNELVNTRYSPHGLGVAMNELPKDTKKYIDDLFLVKSKIEDSTLEETQTYCTDNKISEDLIEVEIFDRDILEKMNWLLEFHKVFGTILSEIEPLNNYDEIYPELALEIIEIINFKKERLALDYPDLCC